MNILFQRGKFDYAATVGTAQALLFYSLGIWCIVGSRVITVSFYSMQDTKTPVKIAVIALATNVIFSIILMNPLKHSGLALSNSIAAGLNFILLFFFLEKKLKQIDTRKSLYSLLKDYPCLFRYGNNRRASFKEQYLANTRLYTR